MGLFKKEKPKPEPVVEYSEHEMGMPEPPKAPEKIDQVLTNQRTIVANQQVILDAVTTLHAYVAKLAESESAEEEAQEEELPKTVVKKKVR